MLRGVPIVMVLLALLAMPVPGAVLFEHGQPPAVFIIDRKASGCQRYAAEELANHVEVVTGAKLPVLKVEMTTPPKQHTLPKEGQAVILLSKNTLDQALYSEIGCDVRSSFMGLIDEIRVYEMLSPQPRLSACTGSNARSTSAS